MPDPVFDLRAGADGPIVIGTPGNVLTITADGRSVQAQPGGSGLPAVSVADNGDVLMVVAGVWAKAALNYSITSFAHAPTVVLLGDTVVTPAFTATYSQAPDVATLTDSAGTAAQVVTATPTAFASLASFTRTVFAQAVSFFLNASRAGTSAAQATRTISWGQLNYHGAAVDPGGGGYTEAFIKTLTPTGAVLSAAGTYAANVSAPQNEFFATRSAYGLTAASFTVGGFPFSLSRVAAAVALTNANGVIENYDLWRSDNVGLGAFNYVVA